MEKKYPIGGYAPGDYWHKACKTCGNDFIGDKRAWNCEPCGEKLAIEKSPQTDPYQPLFDHMLQEHGLTLLESEMADIIHLVEKMQAIPTKESDEQVPEWVEWLCDRSPDVPDLSDRTEEEKKLLVDTLFQSAGIQFMKMFYAVGLDKFMESGLVNDSTGDLFRLRFELMQKGHKQEQKEANT